MRTSLLIISALLLGLFVHAQGPTLILTNGKIFTSDTSQLYTEALAIKDGRIIASGSTNQIEKLAVKGTRRIDLGGRLVVPGFNDAHNHMPDGLRSEKITLPSIDPSWETLRDSIRAIAARIPEGQWIESTIGISIANSRAVNRFEIDKIAPKHPVRLLSWWGHVGIYNTLGLTKMGISTTQADPKGGFYERLPDNKTLTGRALEMNAYRPHTSYSYMASMRDEPRLIEELKGMSRELLKLGITSYQNMTTGASAEDYISLWKKAGLPFRLRLIRWADMNADGSLSIPSKELPSKTPAMPLITVSGTKWLLEGTPLEQGAEQMEAYPGRPDWYGRMNYTMPELERMLRDAIARKDQIHLHVGGSKSIGRVLDLMYGMNVNWKPLRPRFEHGDEIDYSAAYLQKARQMGVIIVQNPTHFAPIPGMQPQPLLKHGMALKSLLTAGIPLAIGSDGPFNPYLNIMLASTHAQRPSEALTREQAVIAYTRTAAFAEFEEQNKGTLTVGKVADLAILSQNIFTADLNQLMSTESIMTLVGGKIVYDKGVLKFK